MRSSMFFVAFLVVMTIAFTAGCGGGGQGFRIPDDPLVITSSTLPAMLSGEYVDHEIPISGGCAGPYVVEVIAGTLPHGVGTVQGTEHKLEGFLLEDGIFSFTIKVTDTTCVPFSTTTQAYVWDIQQGPVAIVAAVPAIIPFADYDDSQKHPGVDALETVVFSQFVSFNLIAAGGQAPYTCSVIDDPNDPLDGALPLGVSMAPNSCSLVGSPVQVLPGGVPFLLTIKVEDAVGSIATRKFQWKIDTPPLILSNSSLADGKAGTSYSDAIQIVDGVPPFAFELTDNAPGDDGDPDTTDNVNDDISYIPGATPLINSFELAGFDFQLSSAGAANMGARLEPSGGRVSYPAEADDGGAGQTYSPMPSEGFYLREAGPGAGSFFGIPRRRGTFKIYVHAYSTLVPNENGQHVFKGLSHTIAPSEPPTGLDPVFDMDPSFTLEGAFPPIPARANLPEAEVTVLYNPDIGDGHPINGLKLKSRGGVAYDGFVDSPHEANRLPDITELAGEHQWSFNELTSLPGMGLFPNGDSPIFGTETAADAASLVRSPARAVEFTVSDLQLPLSVRAADTTVTRQMDIAVGPDVVIITESSQSFSGTTTTSSSNSDMHDRSIKVRAYEALGGAAFVSSLDDGHNTAMHSVPALAGLGGPNEIGQLLSGVAPGDATLDLLRITVNPGGWWNDVGNMHPKGARSAVDGDKNAGSARYQVNGYTQSGGGWHQGASATLLPSTPSVAHAPASGIYNDGGKLYAFNSTNRFGFFIVRSDASIYVPFAAQRGSVGGFMSKFADGVVDTSQTGPTSGLRMVPLAVSPDGRFAVAKVTRSTSTTLSTLSRTTEARLILFSLTGEKFGSGDTYQVINPDTANGIYLFSTSMVMTDQGLFFIQGNSSSTYGSWRDHYIHTFPYRSAGGVLLPGGGTSPAAAALADGLGAQWTQASGTPMQTPFHKWDTPTRRGNSFSPQTGTTFFYAADADMYLYDGWNMGENSSAPVPFRVSADGKHCALLAGPRANSTTGSDVMSHYAWVASNSGDFRQASLSARHSPTGAARGYTLRRGPNSYRHWGRSSGPSTGFEIADDGSAIAFVYNKVGSVSSTSTSNWNKAREDVIVVKGTGSASDPFSSSSETEVTSVIFDSPIIWRFGSLVFTKDNQGLIFWGGASAYNATSTSNTNSSSSSSTATVMTYFGTYYAYNLNVANQVKGILPVSAGGVGSFPTYSPAVKFKPTVTAGNAWTFNLGTVQPLGGFLSRNRDYFYVTANAALGLADQMQLSQLGINIEDLSGGGTASGNTKGRGFKLGGHPTRRGFLPSYHYEFNSGPLERATYSPHHTQGGGMQRMHKDTGTVYWMSHYQRSGPSQNVNFGARWPQGPPIPTYNGDDGAIGFHMEAFNADVGGAVARLTHAGLGSNTATRSGQFFTVSPDGSQVAYVYQNVGPTRNHSSEKIGMVTNVGFDPLTGAPDGDMDNTDAGKAFVAESTGGRAGEGMAFSSTGARLYYAYKSAGANENVKELVQYSTGKVLPKFGAGSSRYNVLHAGRR